MALLIHIIGRPGTTDILLFEKLYHQNKHNATTVIHKIYTYTTGRVGWLVGCYGLNGPLRQYFSLYRAVSQREEERTEMGQMREKMSKQPPPAPTASAVGPCPTVIQIVGRPGTGSLPSTIAPPDHPTTGREIRKDKNLEEKRRVCIKRSFLCIVGKSVDRPFVDY